MFRTRQPVRRGGREGVTAVLLEAAIQDRVRSDVEIVSQLALGLEPELDLATRLMARPYVQGVGEHRDVVVRERALPGGWELGRARFGDRALRCGSRRARHRKPPCGAAPGRSLSRSRPPRGTAHRITAPR